jgi:hypothetical protein
MRWGAGDSGIHVRVMAIERVPEAFGDRWADIHANTSLVELDRKRGLDPSGVHINILYLGEGRGITQEYATIDMINQFGRPAPRRTDKDETAKGPELAEVTTTTTSPSARNTAIAVREQAVYEEVVVECEPPKLVGKGGAVEHSPQRSSNVLVRTFTRSILEGRIWGSGPNIISVMFEKPEDIGVLSHFTAFIHYSVVKWSNRWFVLREPSIQPSNGWGLPISSDAPEDICAMVGDNQICGFAINALEAFETFNVLGTLNAEYEVHGDTLAEDSGIASRIAGATSRLAHLAGPTGIASINRRGIHNFGNPIDVLV